MTLFEHVRRRPTEYRLDDGTSYSVVEVAVGHRTRVPMAMWRQTSETRDDEVAARLAALGFEVSVCVGPEGPAPALAICRAGVEDPVELAGCALWAWQGGDEGATFQVAYRTPQEPTARSDMVAVHRVGPTSLEAAKVPVRLWRSVAFSGSAAVAVDVDWMMAYNDLYGHWQGDLLLARLHTCLASVIGSRGTWFRIGGDEFALELDDFDTAMQVAQAVRQAVHDLAIPMPYPASRGHGVVTVSVAVAQARDDQDLRKVLDQTLYQAKREGRNTVCSAP